MGGFVKDQLGTADLCSISSKLWGCLQAAGCFGDSFEGKRGFRKTGPTQESCIFLWIIHPVPRRDPQILEAPEPSKIWKSDSPPILFPYSPYNTMIKV